MNKYLFILFSIFIAACDSQTDEKKDLTNESLVVKDSVPLCENGDPMDAYTETASYFIVIGDTATDYYLLQKKMYSLAKTVNLPIDTMERYYNKTKDLIALPDSSSDEMYRGEYYPRRAPAEHLSLEYYNFYNPTSGDKTIALVCGIYEKEEDAAKALKLLKKKESKAFMIKAEVFIGCMH